LSWTYRVLKVRLIGAELKIFDHFFCLFLKEITYYILLLILKIFLHYVCFFDVLARRWRGKAQTVA